MLTHSKKIFCSSVLLSKNKTPFYISTGYTQVNKKGERDLSHSPYGWVSYLHRAATTYYLCCGQALEDSQGAGRIGLTHILEFLKYLYLNTRLCLNCACKDSVFFPFIKTQKQNYFPHNHIAKQAHCKNLTKAQPIKQYFDTTPPYFQKYLTFIISCNVFFVPSRTFKKKQPI